MAGLSDKLFGPELLEHRDPLDPCAWLLAHLPGRCLGELCALHNRSAHLMRAFPQLWREDRKIMERICPHGVGHPDPDDLLIRTGADSGLHGCDGCCLPPSPTSEAPAAEPPAQR